MGIIWTLINKQLDFRAVFNMRVHMSNTNKLRLNAAKMMASLEDANYASLCLQSYTLSVDDIGKHLNTIRRHIAHVENILDKSEKLLKSPQNE